jgi:hypothetical protein
MKSLRVLTFACVTLVAGCAVDKYQAAAPNFKGTPGSNNADEVIVLLQPVFAGKPVSEIVCDNTVGVTWSPAESHNIGFTQRYANSLAKNAPQLTMLAALPVNQRIGMSASGSLQPLNVDSRILVPVGRYIAENLKFAIGTNGQVCEDQECFRRAMRERPGARFVSVEFTKFRVAEEQRNMLMLEVEGTASVSGTNIAKTSVPIRNVVNRSITSEGLWHSDFLRAMNNIANESSSMVAEQIRAAGR